MFDLKKVFNKIKSDFEVLHYIILTVYSSEKLNQLLIPYSGCNQASEGGKARQHACLMEYCRIYESNRN